jgi:hypothetical protein
MLDRDFIRKGYCFITPDFYLKQDVISSLHDLKKIFDEELIEDGYQFRKRAYLKLQWNQQSNLMALHKDQRYFQTAISNNVDGGKVRQFKIMPEKILEIPILKNILNKNLNLINQSPLFSSEEKLNIGMHFIRYQANSDMASFSSPAWLHKDDEPLVFVHLINLSRTALGGDNLIADDHTKNVTQVIRLEDDLETLVLNRNVYHAVTPLGSKKGTATRDVILFTVEPDYADYQKNGEIQ